MKYTRMTLLAGVVVAVFAGYVYAHCQIPCGIYGDETRIKLLYEHITTVEKSMQEIQKLSALEKPDYNQLVRWVQNKEDHVAKINAIIVDYFLAQRVKPADKDDIAAYAAYTQKVMVLHQILVNGMKAKQTTDLEYVQKLRELVDAFEHLYGVAGHKH